MVRIAELSAFFFLFFSTKIDKMSLETVKHTVCLASLKLKRVLETTGTVRKLTACGTCLYCSRLSDPPLIPWNLG